MLCKPKLVLSLQVPYKAKKKKKIPHKIVSKLHLIYTFHIVHAHKNHSDADIYRAVD